jgi:hypothetical protein
MFFTSPPKSIVSLFLGVCMFLSAAEVALADENTCVPLKKPKAPYNEISRSCEVTPPRISVTKEGTKTKVSIYCDQKSKPETIEFGNLKCYIVIDTECTFFYEGLRPPLD